MTRPPSLTRVGVSGVEKVIRVSGPGVRHPQLYHARLDCFIHLGPEQDEPRASRFAAAVNEAIGQVVIGEVGFRAEELAQHIAEIVRRRQEAPRAEVTLRARYPEHKPAPVSGIPTQEIYTLHVSAVASAHGTRRIVGVAAQGTTASPATQRLVAAAAGERLAAGGFSDGQIARILDAVPVAAGNERGLGTLHVGCPEGCDTDIDAAALLDIVEGAMSSEIYELLKRADEGAIVEKAHRNPRFVEDCVRGMLRGVLQRYADLPDDAFVSARQENLGTLHQHDVVVERSGLLGELRAERRTGAAAPRHTSAREWLDAVRAVP